MKDSTRKRLEAIIAMVEGPIEDPDWMNMEPEQHLHDLNQIYTICKLALLEEEGITVYRKTIREARQ